MPLLGSMLYNPGGLPALFFDFAWGEALCSSWVFRYHLSLALVRDDQFLQHEFDRRDGGDMFFHCGDSNSWIRYNSESDRFRSNFDVWPWENFTQQAWNSTVDGLHLVKWFKDTFATATYFSFYLLGIVGSLLVILTIRQDTYRKRMTFRALMTATSVADIIYSAVGLPHENVYVSSFVVTSVAVMYFTSIFSDFATLFLTIDRYLSLRRPILWNSLSRRQKSTLVVTAMMVSAFFSCLRLSESCKLVLYNWSSVNVNVIQLDGDCQRNGHLVRLFVVWDVISEVVLPVILFGAMAWLTTSNMAMVRRLSR
ncbi:unnamed protein product, partial [Soboliphyme baturini]|uniref:G_PROTEIN_RECEP_F1_2 domain-containing protein n=1 Tax=Soboliphyme baturini TaxID=241478 RepID=A0A183J678_9BILA